jgi:hypothetical protein
VKKRFPILKKQLEYDYGTQVQLVNALCCLHNFIRLESDGYDDFDKFIAVAEGRDGGNEAEGITLHTDVTEQERRQAKNMRDKIAKEMWNEYRKIRPRRARQ